MCSDVLAERIRKELVFGKKVLWLIPGGSNIPLSVRAMRSLRSALSPAYLSKLAVTLTDERYGPVDHADSNWKQLVDAGFDSSGLVVRPVLMGYPLEETVRRYGDNARELFAWADLVIGQFGIGADGHIAGCLPGSPAIESADTAVSYSAPSFTRITLSLAAIRKVSVAYAFVFGDSKQRAIDDLRNKDLPLSEEPAQILKSIPEAYLYSDV
jgi:6-phosphogluconolactonase